MNAAAPGLRISCPAGDITGQETSGGRQFLGIPFAQPPVGPGRLAPPTPLPPGRHNATQARPAPPQLAGKALALRPVGAIDEDCLHLNIQAPRGSGPHPVWVWIYGGGFTNGDARDPIHEAARLVETHQVVVVTLNYRLGLLGFPPLSEAPNLGLLDQQAALHWVKANIEAFGGNPSQITVLGESAGGMSILAQLTLAGSAGTFQRAVIQSAATSPWLDEAAVARCRQWLQEELGTPKLLPALRALPLPKLLSLGAALDKALRPELGHGVFRPQQGRAGLGTTEEDGIARAAERGLPLLLGCNADEQRLFLFAQRGIDAQAALRRLDAGLKRSPLPAPPEASALWAAYESPLGSRPPWQRLSTAETDLYYQVPLLRRGATYVRHSQGKGSCWLYRFDAPSPALKGQLGASHGLEVPYLFGTLDHPSVRRFAGTDPARWALAETFQRQWLAFATGEGPSWSAWSETTQESGFFTLAGVTPAPSTKDLNTLWTPNLELPPHAEP